MYNIGLLILEVLQLRVFTVFIAAVFLISCILLVAYLFKRK